MDMSVATAAQKWDVHPLVWTGTPSGSSAWATATREPEVPALLVLDSTLNGEPWALAIARASQTIQVHDVAHRLDDPSTRASFAYARHVLGVRRIVLGREGSGQPDGAERARFIADLSALANEHRLPVDGVWYALDARRMFVVTAASPSREDAVHPLVAALFEAPVESLR